MARSSKRIFKTLTIKQENFKNKIIEQIEQGKDINGTQAILDTYNTKNPKVAGVMAVENLSLPSIQEDIRKVLKEKNINIEQISENLAYVANSRPEKVSADAMLKSNLELLKLLGYGNKQISVSFKADLGKLSYKEVQEKLSEVDTELKEVMEGEIQA
mgnify:CR=1 FL=1